MDVERGGAAAAAAAAAAAGGRGGDRGGGEEDDAERAHTRVWWVHQRSGRSVCAAAIRKPLFLRIPISRVFPRDFAPVQTYAQGQRPPGDRFATPAIADAARCSTGKRKKKKERKKERKTPERSVGSLSLRALRASSIQRTPVPKFGRERWTRVGESSQLIRATC